MRGIAFDLFLRIGAAGLALVAMLSAARADDADTSQMVIDAGRLGVMMDQAQRILGLPDDASGDGSIDTFTVLKNAVRAYDRLQPVACVRHLADASICASLYAPAWLRETGAPAPDALRARIDEASDPVSGLWSALCGTLPKEHDPSLCQME